MAVRAYPLDASGGSPAFTGRAWRQLANALFRGRTPTRPLGGRSGILPNQGTPISVSGSTVTITPCAGYADVQSLAIAGGYTWSVDTNQTVTLAAADASNPRIDVIYLQINDNAEDSTGLETAVIDKVTGTPAGSPAVPSIPVRSIALAQVNVPATGSPATISMVIPYTTAAGGILPLRQFSDAPATPFLGEYVDHPTLGLMRSNGTDFAAPLAFIWKYGRAATQAIASSSSFTTVVLDTTLADTAGTGLASNGYVSPVASWVRIQAFATFVGAASGVRTVRWVVNGATSFGCTCQIPGTADGPSSIHTGAPAVLLGVGDVVTVQVTQTSGSSINITSAMLEISKA